MGFTPRVTLLDKLGLLPQLVFVITSGLWRLLTRPITGGNKPKSVFRDVVYAALRTNFRNLTIGREQWLGRTTGSAYRAFMTARKATPETTTLEGGLRLHWFGGKTAEKTIVYFHGGGYVIAASKGHLQWLYDLQKDLSKKNSVNILMVEYTLAPREQYPVQLKQAAQAFKWLVDDQKKSPRDIIIGGDSAGGNLTLALLLHLTRPHPDVADQIKLSEPLSGALLISPWTDFNYGKNDWHRNEGSDYVPIALGRRWSTLFMGSATRDSYNQPSYADAQWLSEFKQVVDDILIWCGGGELLVDTVEALAKKIQAQHPRTKLVIEPGTAHEGFIVDLILGYKEKAEATVLIEGWISSRL